VSGSSAETAIECAAAPPYPAPQSGRCGCSHSPRLSSKCSHRPSISRPKWVHTRPRRHPAALRSPAGSARPGIAPPRRPRRIGSRPVQVRSTSDRGHRSGPRSGPNARIARPPGSGSAPTGVDADARYLVHQEMWVRQRPIPPVNARREPQSLLGADGEKEGAGFGSRVRRLIHGAIAPLATPGCNGSAGMSHNGSAGMGGRLESVMSRRPERRSHYMRR
jgi:hypothetical protein